VENDFKIINTGFFKEFVDKTIKKRDIFTISYLGNFYGILTPVFKNFIMGLNDFIRFNQIFSDELNFVYAGGVSRNVIGRIFDKTEIKYHFSDLGKISQEKCYAEIRKGHVSVYLSAKGSEYVLPTKAFDYIASNTHVLVIGERCATTELFDKVEQKYTRVDDDIDCIYDGIKSIYNRHKKKTRLLKYLQGLSGKRKTIEKDGFDREGFMYYILGCEMNYIIELIEKDKETKS